KRSRHTSTVKIASTPETSGVHGALGLRASLKKTSDEFQLCWIDATSHLPSREMPPPRNVCGFFVAGCTISSDAASAPSLWKRSSAKPGRSAIVTAWEIGGIHV